MKEEALAHWGLLRQKTNKHCNLLVFYFTQVVTPESHVGVATANQT
jgi:hypothetical protein